MAESVQELFRRAVSANDTQAMTDGVTRLFVRSGVEALAPDAEYQVRHEDFVLEMPQSGERIRGRDAMRAMQEAFPTPPTITLRRVVGAGPVWVIEATNDYAGDVWNVVLILEFTPEGRIIRDTRYYTRPFVAPSWRAAWVEPM